MMRLIVSRSTKKTETRPSPTDPAGALASGDRSAAERILGAPRTSSIISNRPGVLVLSTVLVVTLSSTLILSSADGSRRLPVLSLQGSEAPSKFKDVKGSGFEAHLLDVLAKAKGKVVAVARELRPIVPELIAGDLARKPQRQPVNPLLQPVDFRTPGQWSAPGIDFFEVLKIPRDEQLGVGPMIRDWKSISAFALLAGAIMHGSTAAAIDGPFTDEEKLDNIQKQLDKLTRSLTNMSEASSRAATALSDFKKDLTGELDSMRSSIVTLGLKQADAKQGMDDLRAEMARLRSEVDTLRAKVQTNASSYQALYNPNSTSNSTVGTGRVEIVNTYASEVAVVLNRRAYYVPPGETRTIDNVPAGNFTYEVLGIQPPVTRTISPDKIFTVRVYTR
jgi:hypothetical protein